MACTPYSFVTINSRCADMKTLTLLCVLLATAAWGSETWKTDTGATCRVEHGLFPVILTDYVDDVTLWCTPALPTHRRSVRVVVVQDHRTKTLLPTPPGWSRVCRQGPRLRHRPRFAHQSGCCPFLLLSVTANDPSTIDPVRGFEGLIACRHRPSVPVTFSAPEIP
jgi:hypothetical protein